MWKCKACGLLVMFSAVDPEVDENGIYFLCPGCGHRNKLTNQARSGDDALVLGQPDE